MIRFICAFVISALLVFIALILLNGIDGLIYLVWVKVLLAILVIFTLLFICFWVLEKNCLKQIRLKINDEIPGIYISDNNKNFIKSLKTQIEKQTHGKSSEIDFLKGQENYRREFLGNVSHELKTPLFSIQGFLLTLIEGGLKDSRIRDKYLNRINKSVERLTYIVKDLDMISELESSVLQLEVRPFDMYGLTQEVFDLLELKAANNEVQLKFNNAYDSVRVRGDIEKIEQALINLIVNAINHASRPTDVVVSFEQENKKIKITVKDFGVGIPPEQVNRIFERFYRVDQSRSREGGGSSGLGLSIVKHILEAHNEKIHVESIHGKETKFYFYLDKAND